MTLALPALLTFGSFVLSAVVRQLPKAFDSLNQIWRLRWAHRLLTERIAAKDDPGSLVASLGSKLVPVAVGLVSFVVTELRHYLLVLDLGRLWEDCWRKGCQQLFLRC
jgi:hypothetical protein